MPVDPISTCVAQKGIAKVRAKKLNGFSLMEMMVVLLIVAIIAAASAPMVTKKLSRSAGTNDSPWVFTGLNNSIAYNMSGNDNSTVIIGSTTTPANMQGSTRLYIDSGNNASHIAFGINQTLSGDHIVAIGSLTQAIDGNAIAIGQSAVTATDNSIAIGTSSSAGNRNSGRWEAGRGSIYGDTIAIGHDAQTNDYGSIAIGYNAQVNTADTGGDYSIAIGANARANHDFAVALGYNAETRADNQIVLGDENTTVYIPGRLVVAKSAAFAVKSGRAIAKINAEGEKLLAIDRLGEGKFFHARHINMLDIITYPSEVVNFADYIKRNIAPGVIYSDRRMKNIGEKYTAGLTELKKLDFFHYTFKNDETKTPRVGVIAQDLQKVFPDAVTKGEDGYLRIRLEDMFYAVINAVKELDNKIAEIVQNITDINSTIEKQNKTIEEQQKTIDELVKRIEKLEKQK